MKNRIRPSWKTGSDLHEKPDQTYMKNNPVFEAKETYFFTGPVNAYLDKVSHAATGCPKIYRFSVLHLIKFRFAV